MICRNDKNNEEGSMEKEQTFIRVGEKLIVFTNDVQ